MYQTILKISALILLASSSSDAAGRFGVTPGNCAQKMNQFLSVPNNSPDKLPFAREILSVCGGKLQPNRINQINTIINNLQAPPVLNLGNNGPQQQVGNNLPPPPAQNIIPNPPPPPAQNIIPNPPPPPAQNIIPNPPPPPLNVVGNQGGQGEEEVHHDNPQPNDHQEEQFGHDEGVAGQGRDHVAVNVDDRPLPPPPPGFGGNEGLHEGEAHQGEPQVNDHQEEQFGHNEGVAEQARDNVGGNDGDPLPPPQPNGGGNEGFHEEEAHQDEPQPIDHEEAHFGRNEDVAGQGMDHVAGNDERPLPPPPPPPQPNGGGNEGFHEEEAHQDEPQVNDHQEAQLGHDEDVAGQRIIPNEGNGDLYPHQNFLEEIRRGGRPLNPVENRQLRERPLDSLSMEDQLRQGLRGIRGAVAGPGTGYDSDSDSDGEFSDSDNEDN